MIVIMKNGSGTSAHRIRVGVVGTGVMGERHARVYSRIPGCSLVGVYDPDMVRAAAVVEQHGGQAYRSLESLIGDVDAVSVVSPTMTHAAVATCGLDNGLHVLIEKPMTASVVEGETLAARARSAGSVVMVGHIERFNPVIIELQRMLQRQRVRRVRVRRIGPFPERSLDTDVISDVMIHDIDLIQHLFGTSICTIAARGDIVVTDRIDRAVADIELDGGPFVTLVASRVADRRVREIEVVLESATITADLLTSTITITSSRDGSGRCTTTSQPVPPAEPLLAELRHFLNCIRKHEQPAVDATAGLRAIVWAEHIRAAITEATAVGVGN
jgi:predicted dehydrogenase